MFASILRFTLQITFQFIKLNTEMIDVLPKLDACIRSTFLQHVGLLLPMSCTCIIHATGIA